jgi:NAD(P)-dependent dehydrogenase (short-subunit alcohol dehydrogenase family)
MSSSLTGAAVLVTGAARGLGRELALACGSQGARVAALDRNREGVRETVEMMGSGGATAMAVGCDLTDEAAVRQAVGEVVAEFGCLDGVVANAGGTDGERTPFLELDVTAWRRMVDRNLTAAFLTGLHCARVMAGQSRGSIVFISSVGATRVQPSLAHYAAAKAGVAQLARGMASELGPHGIRVNCVAPGSVLTEGNRRLMDGTEAGAEWAARTALGRLGRTADIVGAVTYLLSDAAAYTTGATISIDGGFSLL